MTEKKVQIGSQTEKCDSKCVSHTMFTHNICVECKALKDSPYFKDFLKDKTDEEIEQLRAEALEECED